MESDRRNEPAPSEPLPKPAKPPPPAPLPNVPANPLPPPYRTETMRLDDLERRMEIVEGQVAVLARGSTDMVETLTQTVAALIEDLRQLRQGMKSAAIAMSGWM